MKTHRLGTASWSLHLAQMLRLFKSVPVSTPVLLNFVAEHRMGLPRSA